MKRNLFNLAAGLSLLLFVAAVALWVHSYLDGSVDGRWVGHVWVISVQGDLSLFRLIPNGVMQIDFHLWKWAALFAASPLLWIIRRALSRRRISRPGACSSCGYNLIGNTSGTCPECGTAVVEKAET